MASREWFQEPEWKPAWRHCASCTAILPGHATSGDLVRLGLTYRQLDFWVRKGYLKPIRLGPGRGTDRMFPASEVQVAAKMAAYVAAGLPPAVAYRAVRNGGQLAPGVRIVVDEAAA